MLSTGQTGNVQERNLLGGIQPLTGVKTISGSTYTTNIVPYAWVAGGELIDSYILDLGTAKGLNDIATAGVFPASALSITGDSRIGGEVEFDAGVHTLVWIRLKYSYNGGIWRYIDHMMTQTA